MPKNDFQSFKRSIYILIHNKISEKLFYFLRDKVSPIKYLEERPNKEIWFRKRNSEGKISIEVEIKPISPDTAMIMDRSSGLFKLMGENYKVKIYEQSDSGEYITFPLNHIGGNEQVDYYFSKIDELKQVLRDYKLKNILN
jgi:hypothetical protein